MEVRCGDLLCAVVHLTQGLQETPRDPPRHRNRDADGDERHQGCSDGELSTVELGPADRRAVRMRDRDRTGPDQQPGDPEHYDHERTDKPGVEHRQLDAKRHPPEVVSLEEAAAHRGTPIW